MAANFSSFIIDNQHSNPNYNIPTPEQINEHRQEEEDVGVYINHAILVGEIMGIQVEEAIWAMEVLDRNGRQLQVDFPDRPYRGVPVIKEVGGELQKDLQAVLNALNTAIDAEGRATGEQGNLLKNSPRIGSDDNERLFVKSHHIYLFDLQEKLQRIINFLEYGYANNLMIRLV